MARHVLIRYFPNPDEMYQKEVEAAKNGISITSAMRKNYTKDNESIIRVRLLEEPQLQFSSSYVRAETLLPSSLQLFATMQKFQAGAGGRTGALHKKFDMQFWDRTEPFKIALKILLHNEYNPYGNISLKSNSYNNVAVPLKEIASLAILSKLSDGSYKLPGINLSNMSTAIGLLSNGMQPNADNRTSKLISMEIPGLVYLNVAVIESVSAVISKEITESGHPLWAELSINVLSLESANDSMFSLEDQHIMPDSKLSKS